MKLEGFSTGIPFSRMLTFDLVVSYLMLKNAGKLHFFYSFIEIDSSQISDPLTSLRIYPVNFKEIGKKNSVAEDSGNKTRYTCSWNWNYTLNDWCNIISYFTEITRDSIKSLVIGRYITPTPRKLNFQRTVAICRDKILKN